MGRKGSRASGGHMPLTHYERTKKFAHPSATTTSTTQQEDHYGTLSQRLAGHTQYQIGTCALTTQSLFVRNMMSDTDPPPPPLQKKMDSTDGTNATAVVALCSPSGYIYDPAAIIEYLCQQTQSIRNNTLREQQIADRRIITTQLRQESSQKKRQMDSFQNAQQVIKKKQLVHSVSATTATTTTATAAAADDLHRVSYWLSSAQPTIPILDSGCVDDNDIAGNNNKHMNPHGNIIGTTLALIQDGPAHTGSNSTTTATNSTTQLLLPTTTASSLSSPQPPSTKDRFHHQNHNIIQRPLSPMTQQPFQRRDLWPVQLDWISSSTTTTSTTATSVLCCAVSDKILSNGAPVLAYWTTSQPYRTTKAAAPPPGRIVLQSVYHELVLAQNAPHPATCPITDRPIRHVRTLQRSGSSYAASGQCVVAQQYKPTIT
jgi:hypothetical protein